jgi:hypothetical protein
MQLEVLKNRACTLNEKEKHLQLDADATASTLNCLLRQELDLRAQ